METRYPILRAEKTTLGVRRTVDYLITNPPLIGIVEHFDDNPCKNIDGIRESRVIAVFPATEEGVERAYDVLEKVGVIGQCRETTGNYVPTMR